MKVLHKAGLALCLYVLLCACSKKGKTVTPYIPKVKYLSGIIQTDSLLAPGSDTVSIDKFSYDLQNRLTERITKTLPFNPQVLPRVVYENWFYNGNDSLPFKTIVKIISPSSPDDTQTHYLFYQNGIVIKDSIEEAIAGQSGVSITRALFEIHGDKINSKWDFYSNGTFKVMDSAVSYRTISNGNVMSSVDTFYSTFYNPARINWISNYNCNYDTKNNPFYRVTLPYPVIRSTYFVHWQQKAFNNPINATLMVNNPGFVSGLPAITNSQILVKYEFDTDNYPVVGRPVSTTALPVKAFFTYIN